MLVVVVVMVVVVVLILVVSTFDNFEKDFLMPPFVLVSFSAPKDIQAKCDSRYK